MRLNFQSSGELQYLGCSLQQHIYSHFCFSQHAGRIQIPETTNIYTLETAFVKGSQAFQLKLPCLPAACRMAFMGTLRRLGNSQNLWTTRLQPASEVCSHAEELVQFMLCVQNSRLPCLVPHPWGLCQAWQEAVLQRRAHLLKLVDKCVAG